MQTANELIGKKRFWTRVSYESIYILNSKLINF